MMVTLVILLVGIQFIRPKQNQGKADGPNDITHYVPVPSNVQAILKRSCYNCHSNHTDYPWYFQINPVGFWMASHIRHGKEELNFSDLSGMSERRISHKLVSIADQVENQDMPIGSYTWIHTNAKLSNTEIKIIKDWTAMASQHITMKNN